jgi:hypothetical protein
VIRRGEDVAEQRAALETARAVLSDALFELAETAAKEAKAARSKRGTPDLPAVYAAVRHVWRAEEAVDTATYDLQTASGEDG